MSRRRPEAPRADLPEQYFSWHALGELRLQRCAGCTAVHHPPRVRCPSCQGTSMEWVPVDGGGTVFTWVVTHRPHTPAVDAWGSYVSAVVELDEGARVLTRLVGIEPEEVRPGLRVRVAFEPGLDGVQTAVFTPVT